MCYYSPLSPGGLASVARPLVLNGRDVGFSYERSETLSPCWVLKPGAGLVNCIYVIEFRRLYVGKDEFRQLVLANRVSSIAMQFRSSADIIRPILSRWSSIDSVPVDQYRSYAGDGGGCVELWILVGWDRWSRR